MNPLDTVGFLASRLVFSTANTREMVALRVFTLCRSFVFIAYGARTSANLSFARPVVSGECAAAVAECARTARGGFNNTTEKLLRGKAPKTCARGLSFAYRLVIAVAMTSSAFISNLGPAGAQAYPSRLVTVVVPFPAGGPLDLAARLLGEKLAAKLKQPFVIENRAGVAGNLGTDSVAKAAPDGHTLLMVLDTPLTAHPALYSKLPFDPERDFAPISLIATFSQMLVVHPSVPANSLAEFVNIAKTQRITHGTGGAKGNPGYLAMELFRLKAGFEVVQVGYRGNPQVVADLMAGHVQAGFLATPSVIDLALDGKLRPLAVSSKQRELRVPDVPTIEEAGYPGVNAEFGLVILAPAGTPESIRAILEREVLAALKSPDVQTQLRRQDLHPAALSSNDTAVWLKTARDEWAGLINAASIRLD